MDSDHDKKYGVPSLADLGKDTSECGPRLFPGGETAALERMQRHLKKTVSLCVSLCSVCMYLSVCARRRVIGRWFSEISDSGAKED